jgi:tetratricopeptide (TPR) repeat protein
LYYYYRLPTAKAIDDAVKSRLFIRNLVAFGIICVCLVGIYLTLIRATADLAYNEKTIDSLERAASLTPGNADVHLALAVQFELAGRDPEPQLRAAAALDPLLAEPWLRLGLLAESRGNPTNAERLLLHAAAIDTQLLPRSTLMRFYARREQPAEFWHWARLAFERAYGDSSPLFDLCWQMAVEPHEVYEKAIPRSHEILRSYLTYLLSRGRLPAAAQPAHDLVAQAIPSDRDLILDYTERLLEVSPSEALSIWNAACRRAVLPYPPVQPWQIVDGSFTHEALQKGFDWKIVNTPQLPIATLPGGGVEFSFTGKQPESIELLAQTVSVPPSRNSRLTVDYRTDRIDRPGGIRMEAEDRQTHRLLGSIPLTPSEPAVRQALAFESPPSGFVVVRFRYIRPLGSVRTEGTLTLRTVGLEPAP